MSLFVSPAFRASDANGVLPGATWTFYTTGTTTPASVYTTSALNVAHPNPVVADAAGLFPQIYLDPAVTYRAILKTAAGVTEADIDPIADSAASLRSSLGASSGSSVVGFIQSGSGAVGRTLQDKAREAVSVKDFGATGDGVTDDTTSLTNAINAVQAAGGGTVVIPAGIFRVTSLSILSGAAVNIVGHGDVSIIKTSSATANVLDVSAWYSRVENVTFQSSVTRTAGSYIRLLGAHTRAIGCEMIGDFIGIYMQGVGAKAIRNIFSSGATNAKRIWVTGGDTSQTIESNLMNSQAAGVGCGVFVENSGALHLVNNDIIGQGTCLLIAPGNGQSVFALKSRGNYFDTAVGGVSIAPSGTGVVRRCSFTDDWASSHTQNGIILSASGSAVVDGIDIESCEAHLNGVNGIAITGAGVTNVRVNGGQAAQNVNAGFSADATSSKFSVRGLWAGAMDGLTGNAYGAFITGGASDFLVSECRFTGNTTAETSGLTTTIASAATIAIPASGAAFAISGVTGISAISGGRDGRQITLEFAGALTVTSATTNASSVRLAGGTNFTTVAGSRLTIRHNGTQWFEVSRAA